MADTDKSDEIDPRLLEILVCPQSGGVLAYDRAQAELLSKKAGLAYPIRDGVPIMLAEEARTLSDAEIDKL
jgi:uncharacterized protein